MVDEMIIGAQSGQASSQKGTSPSAQPPHAVSPWYASWVVSFAFWGVMTCIVFILVSNDTWFAWRQVVARYLLRSDYVTLNNNIFDRNQYVVGKVKLRKPGFAVLYFGSQYDLGIRNPIAFTKLLLPGEYTNVQIKADDARLQAEDPALFRSGATLYVVLFYDDGNGIFNSMNPDEPRDTMVVDPLGQPVFAKLTIQ
ncbi:hypothetical protein KBC80_01920 [Candidatus Woesebacteria bacterium]|nr:hypothetical protein [Candidatus Woesebacteria bacterium]